MACNSCNNSQVHNVIPVLISDECSGCYAKTSCVLVEEAYEYLGLEEGSNLKELIEALIDKIKELENN